MDMELTQFKCVVRVWYWDELEDYWGVVCW